MSMESSIQHPTHAPYPAAPASSISHLMAETDPKTQEILETILSMLKDDLTQPRMLGEQVQSYLIDHYSLSHETLESFFTNRLSTLDDVDLDLTFSPLYTPTLATRARYAQQLQNRWFEKEWIHTVVGALEAQGLTTTYETIEGKTLEAPVFSAAIARYVGRMGLDKPIHGELFAAIESHIQDPELQALANVYARESIWQDGQRRPIFTGFLSTFKHQGNLSAERLQYLTDFARTYRPKSFEDFDRQLVSLIASCEEDLKKVDERSYLDDHLKAQYARQVDADRHESRAVESHYNTLIQWAQALREDYKAYCRLNP